jgi:preprotein translocase subunit SecG
MSGFMIGIIAVIHVLTCIALMVAILLQSGKGGGLAGSFGGGTSQTLFGGRGAATFLSRGATILAVVFFLTSLTLGLSSSRPTGTAGGRSLIQEEARQRARQGTEQTPNTAPPMGGAPAPGSGLGTPSSGTGATPQTGTPPATTPGTAQPPTTTRPSTTQPPATAPSNTTTQPPASQQGTQTPQGSGTP